MMAEDALGGESQREIVAGNFVHGQDVEDGGVDEEIDENDGKEAGEDGARNEVAGIFDFVAEVDHAVPAIVGVNGSLHAEEQSGDKGSADGDDDGNSGLSRRCLGGLVQMAAEGKAGDHDDEEGQTFQHCSDVLDFAAHADAFPLQQGEKDDDRDGGDLDFECAVEYRKKMRQVFADDDADGAGGAAGGEPVAQPTMKPAKSPMARREKLYWPPLFGIAAPSSASWKALTRA